MDRVQSYQTLFVLGLSLGPISPKKTHLVWFHFQLDAGREIVEDVRTGSSRVDGTSGRHSHHAAFPGQSGSQLKLCCVRGLILQWFYAVIYECSQ